MDSLIDSFVSKRIVVIGDVMIDRYIYGRVDRISPEAPVPVFIKESEEERPGGAANVVENLRSLGARVDSLECFNVPVKTRYVVGWQQIFRCDDENIEAILRRPSNSYWLENSLISCGALVISDYCKGLIGPWVQDIIREAVKLGKPVIVDTKNPDWSIFKGATVITPNDKEYQKDNWYVDNVLVTCGQQGMILMEKGKEAIRIGAKARQVYDVTGAGDTVTAVLALGLACGLPMLEAAKLANAAAGVVVGKRGTATVTPAELREASGIL